MDLVLGLSVTSTAVRWVLVEGVTGDGDAVDRGRMTADDAQELASGLLQRGRKQTNDVLKDLEQLLGRSRGEIEGRAGGTRKAASESGRAASMTDSRCSTRRWSPWSRATWRHRFSLA